MTARSHWMHTDSQWQRPPWYLNFKRAGIVAALAGVLAGAGETRAVPLAVQKIAAAVPGLAPL
jgi:hypothetical protein